MAKKSGPVRDYAIFDHPYDITLTTIPERDQISNHPRLSHKVAYFTTL